MLTIEYNKSGKTYSDFEVEAKAKQIIDTHLEYLDQDMIYKTSNESLIDAIRVYIVENKINPEKWLQFKFGEEIMPVNKYGNPTHWAYGFCDSGNKRSARILKAQVSLRKEFLSK